MELQAQTPLSIAFSLNPHLHLNYKCNLDLSLSCWAIKIKLYLDDQQQRDASNAASAVQRLLVTGACKITSAKRGSGFYEGGFFPVRESF